MDANGELGEDDLAAAADLRIPASPLPPCCCHFAYVSRGWGHCNSSAIMVRSETLTRSRTWRAASASLINPDRRSLTASHIALRAAGNDVESGEGGVFVAASHCWRSWSIAGEELFFKFEEDPTTAATAPLPLPAAGVLLPL